MSNLNQQDASVYAEQLRLLYSAIPLSVTATLTNSFIMIVVLWPVIAQPHLILWGVAMLLVMSVRTAITIWYNKQKDSFSLQHWGRLFTAGVLMTAVIWSCAAVFLFPEQSIVHQTFIAFIFAGMTAGSVTTLSYLLTPALFYILLMLIPLCVQFFLVGEGMALAMGIMIIAFLIIIMSSMRRFYENSRNNIELRFDAVLREKALKESQNKYENIFRSAPLGIAHFDKDGHIIDCNATFCRLADNDRESLIGSSVLGESTGEEFRTLLDKVRAGPGNKYETDASIIGGKSNIFIRTFFRDLESEHETVMIVEDVTNEKRVEKLKDEFISNVSHELRTPLTAINGSISLIANGAAGALPEKVTTLSKIAASNAQHLLLLIDDILDLGKIESNTLVLNIEPVLLNELLANSVEDNRPYGRQLGVTYRLVNIDKELRINADSGRLSQVLNNLLSNAAKFSASGDTVEIRLVNNNGLAIIEVVDHGPGIPDDFHTKIFDRFTQSDGSSTRAKGGTGLGLSIAKALVEQMGGKIGFETELNNGTTFFIEFPCIE